MEGPLWELLIPFWSINKHSSHRQFLFLISRFLKQLFLWNSLAKWYERLLISFWSINKNDCHCFRLVEFLKIIFSGQKKKYVCLRSPDRPQFLLATLWIFTQNSDNHFCCLTSSNVLFIQLLAFCRNWEQRSFNKWRLTGNFENEISDSGTGNDYFWFCR